VEFYEADGDLERGTRTPVCVGSLNWTSTCQANWQESDYLLRVCHILWHDLAILHIPLGTSPWQLHCTAMVSVH